MKPLPSYRPIFSVLPASILLGLGLSGLGFAASLTWDSIAGDSQVTGGDGAWNTTTAMTWTADGGVTNSVWDNAADDDAVFGAEGGTVTVTTVSTAGITFQSPGYSLTGSTITLAGAGPFIDAQDGVSTISSVLAGAAGLMKYGPGTLVSTANNTYTGQTTIAGGVFQLGTGGTTGKLSSTATAVLSNSAELFYNLSSKANVGNLPPTTGDGKLTVRTRDVTLPDTIDITGDLSIVQNGGGGLSNGIRVNKHTTLKAGSITLAGDVGNSSTTPSILTLDTSATNGPIELDISTARKNVWYPIGGVVADAGLGTVAVTGTGAVDSGFTGNVPVTLRGQVTITTKISKGGPLVIDATGPSQASGEMSGAMTLEKKGSGTLTLNGTTTYTGLTTVHAGLLVVPAGKSSAPITVLDGASLGVTGSGVFKPTELTLGTAGDTTLTISNFTGSATTAPVEISTTFAAAGLATLDVRGMFSGPGTFPLIKYPDGGYAAGTDAALHLQLPAGVQGALVDDPNNKTFNLVVSSITPLVWAGTVAGGVWDINSTANWVPTSFSPDGKYIEPAVARFDDTVPGTTVVDVAALISPASVVVDNSEVDYGFSGTGAINASGALVKSGTGKVTFATDNPVAFGGGALVQDGTLEFGNGLVNGSTGDFDVMLESVTSTLVLNNASDQGFSGVISGNGSLTKTGAGVLTLSGANTFAGDVSVVPTGAGGGLKLGNASGLGAEGAKTITVGDQAQLDFAGFSPGANRTYHYVISGDGGGGGALVNTGAAVGANSGIASLALAGNATIGGTGGFYIGVGTGGTITGNGCTLTKTGSNEIRLSGDASGSPINIVVGAGTLAAMKDGSLGGAGGNVTVLEGAKLGATTVTINTPLDLKNGATLYATANNVTSTWTGPMVVSGVVTVSPNNSTRTINLDGVIEGTGAIDIYNGTVNLSALNTFTGGLKVGAPTTSETTVVLEGGAKLVAGSDAVIQVGAANASATPTAYQYFYVDGTVENEGSLVAGRVGVLNLRSGGNWIQNGDMTVKALGGYGAIVGLDSGSTFRYNGLNPILVNGGSSSTGVASLQIGGDFHTKAGFLQTATAETNRAVVTLSAGATLHLEADVAELGSGISFTLGTGGGTIDTRNYQTSLAAVISGTGSIAKAGSGKLTLTGANTYSGTTTVAEGTLAGTGSPNSDITVLSGSFLSPGSGVGTLLAKSLRLNTGAALAVEIDTTLGAADKLVSSGGADITGANVMFSEVASGPVTDKFVILDYTGGALTGTFDGYPDGSTVTIGSFQYLLNYYDSSRITLTPLTGQNTYSNWAALNAGGGPVDGDADGDGVSNGVEYFMGETGSGFTANPGVVDGKVTWPKSAEFIGGYAVETSPDLAVWTAVTDGVVDNGTSVEYTLPTGEARLFLRLAVTPE